MRVEFEWGLSGATHYAAICDLLVVIDTLSFSTAVDVATNRDVAVYPFPSRDYEEAQKHAQKMGALVANKRAIGPYSLSPNSLLELPRGSSLVLPSPNGSHISAFASSKTQIILGCFRNASAVAAFLQNQHKDSHIAIIAAGERWPDQTLRPAIEDLLAAGAIINKLDAKFSGEAQVAKAAFAGVRENIDSVILDSFSGHELREMGFPQDVEVALEMNVSRHVPIFNEGAFKKLDVVF